MITLFTELSGFGTDYRISIKLADFMVILRSIVFFAECLKPSYSTLVIKNASSIKYYAEESFDIEENSSNKEKLRHSFFFGIVCQDRTE